MSNRYVPVVCWRWICIPDFPHPLLTFLHLFKCLERTNSLWLSWAPEEEPAERVERQMQKPALRSLPPESGSLLRISLVRRQIKIQGLVPHFLHNACVQIFACRSGSKEPGDTILTVVLSQTIAVLCVCE